MSKVQLQNGSENVYPVINEPIVVETVDFSLNAGVSGWFKAYIIGRIAIASGIIRYGSAGTNLNLAWVPLHNSKYCPVSETWLSSDYYGSTAKHAEAKIKTDGDLNISQPEGNVDLKISGCWVING